MVLRSTSLVAVAAALMSISSGAAVAGSGCRSDCGSHAGAYKTVTREVVVRRASRKFVREPAVVEPREVRVKVRSSRVRFEREPAEYETVMRRVMVSPPRVSYARTPAVYKTVHKKVRVGSRGLSGLFGQKCRHRHARGHKCNCHHGRHAHAQPAYKTVTRRVRVSGGRLERHVTPGVYKMVPRKRLKRFGRVRAVRTPAVYKTVTRNVVVKRSRLRMVETPAVTKTVTHRVRTAPVRGFSRRASHRPVRAKRLRLFDRHSHK